MFLLSDESKVRIHIFVLEVVIVVLYFASDRDSISPQKLKFVISDSLRYVFHEKLTAIISVSDILTDRYAEFLYKGKVGYKAFVLQL